MRLRLLQDRGQDVAGVDFGPLRALHVQHRRLQHAAETPRSARARARGRAAVSSSDWSRYSCSSRRSCGRSAPQPLQDALAFGVVRQRVEQVLEREIGVPARDRFAVRNGQDDFEGCGEHGLCDTPALIIECRPTARHMSPRFRPVRARSRARSSPIPSSSRISRFRSSRRWASRRRALLERLLSLFADVRAGEGVGVAAADVERLPAARRLLPAEAGARRRSSSPRATPDGRQAYSAAAQAVLLMGVVPLFGWLASRVAADAADHHDHAVLRLQPGRLLRRWAGRRPRGRRVLHLARASSTSSSSRSSGRSPTTSTRKARAGGCFRWSASARRWALGRRGVGRPR